MLKEKTCLAFLMIGDMVHIKLIHFGHKSNELLKKLTQKMAIKKLFWLVIQWGRFLSIISVKRMIEEWHQKYIDSIFLIAPSIGGSFLSFAVLLTKKIPFLRSKVNWPIQLRNWEELMFTYQMLWFLVINHFSLIQTVTVIPQDIWKMHSIQLKKFTNWMKTKQLKNCYHLRVKSKRAFSQFLIF